MNIKAYFDSKKVTIVGLGNNSQAVSDAEFLARSGAKVTLALKEMLSQIPEIAAHFTPVKAEEPILARKRKDWRENVVIHEGGWRKEDFTDADLLVLEDFVGESYEPLKDARAKAIPVETSETLFFKLAPPVLLIGVTGTCGKSTVTEITGQVLKAGWTKKAEQFFYINPSKGVTALSILPRLKRDDVVLMELGMETLEILDKAHMSPHICVVTNLLPNHLEKYKDEEAYYEAKSAAFKYQTYNSFLVASDDVVDFIKKKFATGFKGKIMRTGKHIIPHEWHVDAPGYMKENIALALRVGEILQIDQDEAQAAVESFKGLKGRLEFLKKIREVSYYNDGTSTHPFSTVKGLSSIARNKNAVLIVGGADRKVDLANFVSEISQYVHTLVLMPGSGTMRLHRAVLDRDDIKHVYAHSVYDAVNIARDNARKGDIVLFSPAFSSRGLFKSPEDRSRHFSWAVKGV